MPSFYDKDRLDAAYATVRLFADSAWQTNDKDGFARANKELWMQECALRDASAKIGMPRSVLDIIPDSRLAKYGNYLYDEQREKSYEPANHTRNDHFNAASTNYVNRFHRNEDFLLNSDVEELFCILTDPIATTSEIEERCFEFIEDRTAKVNRYHAQLNSILFNGDDFHIRTNNFDRKTTGRFIDNNDDFTSTILANQRTENADNVDDYDDNNSDTTDDDSWNPPPRGTPSTFNELILQMQLHSPDVRSLWDAAQYSFNANLFQFYPKFFPQLFCQVNTDVINVVEEHFNNLSEMNYENILIPSMQSWLNYSYPTRASDFDAIENLVTLLQALTHSKQSQQHEQEPIQTTNTNKTTSVTTTPPLQPSQQISQSYKPPQSQNSQQQQTQLPSTHQQQPEQHEISSVQQQERKKQALSSNVGANGAVIGNVRNIGVAGREPIRRLYSAVLQNQCAAGCCSAAVDELDELEREALEQYRPSVESLTRASNDSIISAKFQELERLALEQYSSSASSTETCTTTTTHAQHQPITTTPATTQATAAASSTTQQITAAATATVGATGNSANPLCEPPCGGRHTTSYAALVLANSILVGFYRSVAGTRLLSYLGTSGNRFR